jgi:DNA polymerase III delta subunit
MKTILLSGDHLTKSYERLSKFMEVAKRRGWEIISLDGGGVENLPEKLSTQPLFPKEILYILKEVNKIKKNDLKWLNKNFPNLPGTLVIYQEGNLNKDTSLLLPKEIKKEEFKLPRLIFNFLDSFYPGNTQNCLKLFHQLIQNEPPEFVFALLGRHLRDLYWILDDPKTLKYESWRKEKLLKQGKYFGNKEKIAEIIDLMAEIDIKVKTSEATLTNLLDHLIITKLE